MKPYRIPTLGELIEANMTEQEIVHLSANGGRTTVCHLHAGYYKGKFNTYVGEDGYSGTKGTCSQCRIILKALEE